MSEAERVCHMMTFTRAELRRAVATTAEGRQHAVRAQKLVQFHLCNGVAA